MTNFAETVDDLRWLYMESACELGYRATPFAESAELRFGGQRAFDGIAFELVPGWISAPPPSPRARAAATRQKRIRDTLRLLSREDRHIIDAAYGLRNMASVAGGQALLSEFGQAAQLAYSVLRQDGTREQAEEASQLLQAAQRRYLKRRRKEHGKRYDKAPENMSIKEQRAERVKQWRESFGLGA